MNTNKTNTADMECAFTVQFDKNPEKAKHFNELLEHLVSSEHFADLDIDEVWGVLDTMEREERMKKVKKQLKRKAVKKAAFKPVGLKKPPNRMNLFRAKFKDECKEEGRDYSKEYFESAYKALSEEKLAELDEECTALKEVYEKKFNLRKLRAIYNGEYSPDEPKRACSNYMMFSKACHAKDSSLLSKSQLTTLKKADGSDFKKMISVIKELWDKLKHEEKSKFKQISDNDKIRYKCQLHEHHVLDLEAQIRLAQSKNETIRVSELESELADLKDTEPEEFEEYTGSDDYVPLYDFSVLEEEPQVEEEEAKPKRKPTRGRKSKKKVEEEDDDEE